MLLWKSTDIAGNVMTEIFGDKIYAMSDRSRVADAPSDSAEGGEARGVRNIHDATYKLLFGIREAAKDLLRYHVPADVLGNVDFDTLERFPETNIAKDMQERRSDLIWRVRTDVGQWSYMYILQEFQSQNDVEMVLRILEYVAVFLRSLYRLGLLKLTEKLPLVVPVVVYNGIRPWTAARSLAELQIPVQEPLRQLQPQIGYFLIDIGRLSQESIENNKSIPSFFFRMERARTWTEMLAVLKDTIGTFSGERHQEICRIFLHWFVHVGLRRVGIPEDKVYEATTLKELGSMLETNAPHWLDAIRKEGEDNGRREGEDKGRREGDKLASRRIARNLASINMDERQIATMTGLSLEEVREAAVGHA